MMESRDRQNEVVVAVIAFGVIAMAITFGIVLSLGNQAEDPTPTATGQLIVNPDADNNGRITAQPDTNTDEGTEVPVSSTATTDAIEVAQAATTIASVTTTAAPSQEPASSTATETASLTPTDESPTSTSEPSSTPTFTATSTATATFTLEATITPSLTETLIPSDTPSPAATATASNTLTSTPTATFTATETPTQTASATATHTETFTLTYTPTYTASATSTLTPTSTATFTPSLTPSNTATFTPSATLTPTLTPTPTLQSKATRVSVEEAKPERTPIPTSTITPFPTLTITPFILPATEIACEPRQDWVEYVVQPGDILFEIARASGFNTDAVRAANCITGSDIFAGQVILVPPDSPFVQPQVNAPVTVPQCGNPGVQILFPTAGAILREPIVVRGIADNEFFGFYRLVLSPNPDLVLPVAESDRRVATQGSLGTLNVPAYPAGAYTLILDVINQFGDRVDRCLIPVILEN